MKIIVTLFWGFCIGQAINYIGSSLTGGSYNFVIATLIGLISAGVILLIGQVIPKTIHTGEIK
ncbi:MAG: YjzD family protein [Carnobacterium sp.]|nr:YjzD family protein [Carnobacterium sp.]